AIWVGGHLYIAIAILPRMRRKKTPEVLLQFEQSYEPLGLTALALLVVTGVWMALQFGIDRRQWFSFSTPIERLVSVKLLLLFTTVLFAISAQARVIPVLKSAGGKRTEMAVHVVAVTLLGLAMLILGSFARYGGI